MSIERAMEKRFLILRLSAIGDVVRALPSLRTLRQNFPEAYIAWVVEERAADVLVNHPDLDELFIVPRNRWKEGIKRAGSMSSTFADARQFIEELRSRHFDVALDFHGIFKSGLIAFLSGAPKRYSFSFHHTKELNFLFNNIRLSPINPRLPRVERNLSLLSPLVDGRVCYEATLGITEEDEKFAQGLLEAFSPAQWPLIAIHPSTRRPLKMWPEENFARLAEALQERLGATVVFTGSAGDSEVVGRIIQVMKKRTFFAQTQNLRQLAAFLRHCHLFITLDTGPMHIAALMKKPVVALFGPTDTEINRPYGQGHAIISRGLPCSPCDERHCKIPTCMLSITVEEVFQGVEKALKGGKPLSLEKERGFPSFNPPFQKET